MDRRRLLTLTSVALAGAIASSVIGRTEAKGKGPDLWQIWDNTFARARFVSLSHVLTPDTPLWKGFPPPINLEHNSTRLRIGINAFPPSTNCPLQSRSASWSSSRSWSRCRKMRTVTSRRTTCAPGNASTGQFRPAAWSWCDRTVQALARREIDATRRREISRSDAWCSQDAASRAKNPAAWARNAGCGLQPNARRGGLAAEQRLHAGQSRRQISTSCPRPALWLQSDFRG